MAARNFLPRCTAFFNRIPMESLKICYSNAVHLGKKFLAAIFSAILYCQITYSLFLDLLFNNVAYSWSVAKDRQLIKKIPNLKNSTHLASKRISSHCASLTKERSSVILEYFTRILNGCLGVKFWVCRKVSCSLSSPGEGS